ncbi:MAG: 23S rRNA (pseudouridine(1915)-N(3))-methyltransferase RlmH [Flavobacteriales bacterium]
MKIKLYYISKKDKELASIIEEQEKRINQYINFESIRIEPGKSNSSDPNKRKEEEEQKLLSKVQENAYCIILNKTGKHFTSKEFAAKLKDLAVSGTKNIIFIIGGAYGFSNKVKEKGDLNLSISKMTFPHQLTRLIFTEQLYRAFTIIKGHPYHNE